MKTNRFVFLVISLFFTVGAGQAQQITVNKDSIYFPQEFSHDTLVVYNTGSQPLIIDSLFSVHNEMSYRLEVQAKDTTLFYTLDGAHAHFRLTMEAADSALFIFEAPDLCAICKTPAGLEYFEDDIIMMSNSLTDDSLSIFSSGQGLASALNGDDRQTPEDFVLGQNYPNPFNSSTVIPYRLPALSHVELSIYTARGRKAAVLISNTQAAGKHRVLWDASGFASGVYYYQLTTGNGFVQTKKLLLLK